MRFQASEEEPDNGLVKTVSSPIRLLLQLLLQLSGEADCRLCSLHRGHLLSRDTIRRGLYAYGISIYPIFLFVKPRIILAGYFLLDCACPACYNLRYKEVDEMSDKQQKVVANIAKIAGNLPDDARERILVFAQGVSAGASLRDDRKGEENNGEKTK